MFILKWLRIKFVIFLLIVLLLWLAVFYFTKSPPKTVVSTDAVIKTKERSVAPVLDIDVYYECLCPDSRSFFVNELLPTVERLSSSLNVDFVPYGKAHTTVIGPSKYTFKCQHGPQECLGNKIHSCALLQIPSSDLLARTNVLTCMISGKVRVEDSGMQCAQEYNLDWDKIWTCANGNQGNELLKKSGDKTNGLVPRVSFIPTILLNHELGNQAAILKDLWKEVCKKLEELGEVPSACSV